LIKAKTFGKRVFCAAVVLFFAASIPNTAFASGSGDESGKSFDPGKTILHHVKDEYKWHFFTLGDFHATLHFPVILYTPDRGFASFSSKNLYKAEDNTYNGFKLEDGDIKSTSGAPVYDISITKNVFAMLISVVLMLFIFLTVAKRYKQSPNAPPKGIQSLFEPIIVFVRDEIARPSIGRKWAKYFPYLITVFFFIWINNLLGLIPGAANVTGDIAVTLCLSLITFIVINVSANKEYWKHIFNTPGVPWWLKFPIPIIPFVEFMGIFTKPFALTVRLFANITAGHILILSVISLIFVLGQQSEVMGYAVVAPLSMLFTIFLYFLELLVAALQAYIFTMLSALFIGEAVADHHEDQEAEQALESEQSQA
jgi:F-type H+-transporting ATPase subunit a